MAVFTIDVDFARDHPSQLSGTRRFQLERPDDSFTDATLAKVEAAQWALTSTVGSHVHVLDVRIVSLEV